MWLRSAYVAALLLAFDVVAVWWGATFSLGGRATLDVVELVTLVAIAVAAVLAWLRRWPGIVALALAGVGLRWAWIFASVLLDVGLGGLFDELAELMGYVLGLALLFALVAAHGLTARQQWRSRGGGPTSSR